MNVNRAAAIGIIAFSIVLAGVIGARIDQTTIALLGGVFIGLVVAVPACAAVAIIVAKAQQQSNEYLTPTARYHVRQEEAYMPPPPMQATLPAVNQGYLPAAPQRKFYVLGEDGSVNEVNDF